MLEDLEGVDESLRQVIYALERARDANRAHADRLLAKLDYNAEFPAEDADSLDKAIKLITVIGRLMSGATWIPVNLPAPSYATGSGDAYTEFWDEHEMLSMYRLGRMHAAAAGARISMDDNDVLVGCEQRGIHVWGERSEDFEAGVRFAERFHSIKENDK